MRASELGFKAAPHVYTVTSTMLLFLFLLPSFHPCWLSYGPVQDGRPQPTATMASNAGLPREDQRGAGPDILSLVFQQLGIAMETFPYQDLPDRTGMRGTFCKNLFLKDRKGQFYLVICPEGTDVNLKWLKVQLNAHRNFSFGSPEDLRAMLGVSPGGVTPLGLIFDVPPSIRIVIDHSLTVEPDLLLNFHPLAADKTMLLTFENLDKFIKHTGHAVEVLRFV